MAFLETNPGKQPYKFTEKELDNGQGIGIYDSHARQQDTHIPRFLSIDPHAESYYCWSPYTYVGNNPMRLTDPTGMDWYEDEDGNSMWKNSKAESFTNNNVTWNNSGNSKTLKFDNITINFTQSENENGNLTLHSYSTIEIGGVIRSYDLDKAEQGDFTAMGSVIGERPLKSIPIELGLFGTRSIFINGVKEVLKEIWSDLGSTSDNNLYFKAGKGKGERGYAGNALGTGNPFKHMKPDPNKKGNVLIKNPQTGKTISKPAPPGYKFPEQ